MLTYYSALLIGCLIWHDKLLRDRYLAHVGMKAYRCVAEVIEEFIVLQSEAASLTEEALESMLSVLAPMKRDIEAFCKSG